MQDKKYYYDEQVKNYYYEQYINSFSKVKGNLEDTSLVSLLENETKQVLIDIAKRLELKGYSKLGKEALVNLIAEKIEEGFQGILGELTYREVIFLERLCKKDLNEYVFNIEELNLVGALTSLGLLSKLNIDKKLYLAVAKEAKKPLKKLYSNKEYMDNLKERSKGAAYIDGLMIHYGMIDGAEVYRLLTEGESKFINKEDLDFYINYIFRSYEAFKPANSLIHPYLLVPEDVYAEIYARPNVAYDYNNFDYYISLGEDFKGSWTPEILNLRSELINNGIKEKEVDSVVTELIYNVKNEIGTMSIVDLLEKRGIKFKDGSNKTESLITAVAAVYNTTPIWTLKGTSPLDLEARSKTTLHVENKVGRNDPCPCGSGKKYKKCCGR